MYYINGEWYESDQKEQVKNPATLEVIDTISLCGKEETKQAIEAAKEAFQTWGKTTGNERSAYLFEVVRLMKERIEELAQIITLENGKPLPDAKREVLGAISYLDWYAEEAKRIYGDVLPSSHKDKQLMVIRQPVGVCGAITPWNFPLSMITRKIAPALAAGCTVVLKPALETPLSAIKVFECFHEAKVPKGVVNLVIGPAEEIGKELTSSPDVRKLTFTGSTAIGKKLMRDSADTMKKVSMELGGHAPYIVFEDADLDLAVEGVLLSKFKNSGQTCISTNRVYVQESIADEFAQKLAEQASKLKIGDGLEKGTDVGPLINEKSLEKMKSQVEDAVKHDAKVVHGGNVYKYEKGNGYFFEPTVLLHATDDMQIATEETFGPIAPVFTFKDEDEVVERANHKTYGLAAYCYTKNLGRGMRMMKELEFGIIGINDPAPIVIQAPFGGIKESGMGKEGGKYGLEEYLEEKFVSIYEN
ncbi:succinate-semialdehyde dehydrogenase/glutarate-semialdehyde dehydrogenase [Bacillus thermophilus]|uniref:Succinate-semialdehyde dehydrogenase/glutarate-semialdehyde dehydrogenase n=1 Tax=Siminovitchia thermophila TaxID=1245522 RepID=A0ABS2R958_9BACI|nr:NAD-dependent succinate-semialdehyde dehydrogenase [Siminovitchia thermophila]MBM7715714.1 succinate-semialdehyde dehydrogenase/glutarate-semialdehyde dehydrogenase [Siminovitchia thermophila]ONK21312.1 succinate-semialdehyde dehydrogenase (NADP(+)) [Bacillus sp. VT-16-64]